MIDTSELTLGNLVYCKNLGACAQVLGINYSDIYVEKCGKMHVATSVKANQVFPIPVTKNFLEMNGWKLSNGLYSYSSPGVNLVVWEFRNYWSMESLERLCDVFNSFADFRYIHQFQNLLKLKRLSGGVCINSEECRLLCEKTLTSLGYSENS